jgi:hypothetical protein
MVPHLRAVEREENQMRSQARLRAREDLVEPEEVRQQHEQATVMDIHNPPDVNVPAESRLIGWQIIRSFYDDEGLLCGGHNTELSLR